MDLINTTVFMERLLIFVQDSIGKAQARWLVVMFPKWVYAPLMPDSHPFREDG